MESYFRIRTRGSIRGQSSSGREDQTIIEVKYHFPGNEHQGSRLDLPYRRIEVKKSVILLAIALFFVFAAPVASQEITDNFWITVGAGIILDGGGSGYNGGEWYVYPSNWINQWFYDHPFDATRGKIIHIEFDWAAMDPQCTTDITVAVNWSTPAYSGLGLGDTEPPLPGCDEALYIIRQVIVDQCGVFAEPQHVVFDYIIWDYNPEWVSIDVMGCNFVITNGVIVHECAVGNDDTSWGTIKSIVK